MPDELDKKNNGDGGTGGEAGASAATDEKKEEKKIDDAGAAGAGDETITIKKSDWDKTNVDLANYKEATVRKKADERSLEGGSSNNNGENPAGAGGGSGNAATQIDEKKVTEVATAAATKVQRDTAQKTAKQSFFRKNPQYLNDDDWKALMENTTFRGSETTPEEYYSRLEAGMYEHLRVTGKLESFISEQREKAREEGIMEGVFGSSGSVGNSGNRTQGAGNSKGGLTQKGTEMASKLHVDPKKAEAVDPKKDNEIGISNV